MNVLILFSSKNIGGAEISLSRMALLSNKTKKNIKYKLATISGRGDWYRWIKNKGHKPLIFGTEGSFYKKNILFSMYRLFVYLKMNRFDAIYVCGVRLSFYMRFLKLFLYPTILFHGVRWNPDSNNKLDFFFRILERSTGFLIDGWIVNSLAAQITLEKKCNINRNRIHLIYNGINSPKKFSNTYNNSLEVLTVANLSSSKRYLDYLKTIQIIIKHVPKAHFIFIGRDNMNGIIQKNIKTKGLNKHISYLGFKLDVRPWLKKARLCVLPSFKEGCPTILLEAASYGIPCVAYKIDGIPEIIKNKEHGFLCKPGNIFQMSKSIIKLLTKNNLYKSMSRKFMLHVIKNFSLKKCVELHYDVFSSLEKKI
jgi:glycosyltransferase involved in cell wall biosynthesis